VATVSGRPVVVLHERLWPGEHGSGMGTSGFKWTAAGVLRSAWSFGLAATMCTAELSTPTPFGCLVTGRTFNGERGMT